MWQIVEEYRIPLLFPCGANIIKVRETEDLYLNELKNQMDFFPAWEDLNICNDFLFGKIMQDAELCKELLQRILPDLEIDHIENLSECRQQHGGCQQRTESISGLCGREKTGGRFCKTVGGSGKRSKKEQGMEA